MCIGIPMQVVDVFEGYALCRQGSGTVTIDTRLVGQQPVGTWLLTFLQSAREVISPEQAQQIENALQALNMVMAGNPNIDHLFQDLVDREPQLPDFLQPQSEPREN